MKRYEKYKPTGIQWLPEIPEHWNIKYLFQVSHEHYISNKDIHHQNLLSLSYGKIVHKDINTTEGLLPASFDTYQIIEPGNIVFRFTDLQNDHKSLRVGLSKETGIITSAYIAVAVDKDYVLPEYFYYTLHSFDIKKLFYSMGSGLRQSLNYNGIRKLRLPIPPIDEQIKTIAYLDKRITLIDNCKCQRERELQTLNELKQAEIASVVTRGLNPDVPMKDSGIPWIGQIPVHWNIRRAKFMFKKEKREVRSTDRVITCFRDGQVTLRENRRTTGFTESITEIGYQGIRKGDLIIHQMDAFAGSIGVSDSDGKGTSVYHCCTPKGPYIPEYYALVLREMARTGYIQSLYRGIRERSSDFNFQTFGKQYLPIPPEDEQKEIVNFIHTRINKIDTMIEALKAEIDRLTEYKQRLISDVVTGQIDVRGEQI